MQSGISVLSCGGIHAVSIQASTAPKWWTYTVTAQKMAGFIVIAVILKAKLLNSVAVESFLRCDTVEEYFNEVQGARSNCTWFQREY